MAKVEKSLRELSERRPNENAENETAKAHNESALQTARIVQKANRAITEFKDCQENYAAEMKDGVRRQAQIMQNGVGEEEVEEMLANPEKSKAMLQAKLLDGASLELENNVSDIIDKYNDIAKLEKVRI